MAILGTLLTTWLLKSNILPPNSLNKKGKFNTSVAQGYEIPAVILVYFACL